VQAASALGRAKGYWRDKLDADEIELLRVIEIDVSTWPRLLLNASGYAA
jgi:hypothetical protein